MGYVVQPSSGEIPVVPDSLYLATIVAAKHVTLDQPDQFGKTEKIELSVEFDVDGEIVTLDPRVNAAWSEKATLFQIAIATGLDVSPQDAFEIEELLDRQVNILTEQEEGKWPRVKAWSRVGRQKASRPSPEPPEASAKLPAVVNPDGTPNHDAFWRAIKGMGLNRAHVIDKVGSIENFTALDGADIAFLLEELRVQVEAV